MKNNTQELGNLTVNELLNRCEKRYSNGLGQLNCKNCPMRMESYEHNLNCATIISILNDYRHKKV